MTEEKFDEAIRGLLEGAEETPAPEIWAGIEGAMARKSRMRVIRRAFGYAAAAACLAGVLLLSGRKTDEQAPVLANEVAVAVDNAGEAAVLQQDVAPVAQQIERIERRYAQAADAVVSTETAEDPAVRDEVPTTAETPADQPSNGPETVEPAEKKSPSEVREEREDDWWNRPEPVEKQRRHALLAVNSNITSIASEGGSFSNFGPAHVSSQTGSTASSGLPVPVDNPTYFLPLSFGAQVKIPVSKNWSVGIGADYTYIVTRYASLVNSVFYGDTYTQLHYVGIPVTLSRTLASSDRFGAYASVGGMIDKCVSSRYVFGSNVLRRSVDGFQYSVMAGLGVEYWLVDNLGLYLDPSVVYYFGNEAHPQPLSIRTAEPLQVRFEAGLRFKF